MVDTFSKNQRSAIMSRVRGKNTGPERLVRQTVTALGYRYRLNRRDLPGAPDLVFAGRRKVIFVNGCFWHLHSCKRGRSTPSDNGRYWRIKRRNNALRDRRNQRKLRSLGWSVLTIWECQLLRSGFTERVSRFLKSD